MRVWWNFPFLIKARETRSSDFRGARESVSQARAARSKAWDQLGQCIGELTLEKRARIPADARTAHETSGARFWGAHPLGDADDSGASQHEKQSFVDNYAMILRYSEELLIDLPRHLVNSILWARNFCYWASHEKCLQTGSPLTLCPPPYTLSELP